MGNTFSGSSSSSSSASAKPSSSKTDSPDVGKIDIENKMLRRLAEYKPFSVKTAKGIYGENTQISLSQYLRSDYCNTNECVLAYFKLIRLEDSKYNLVFKINIDDLYETLQKAEGHEVKGVKRDVQNLLDMIQASFRIKGLAKISYESNSNGRLIYLNLPLTISTISPEKVELIYDLTKVIDRKWEDPVMNGKVDNVKTINPRLAVVVYQNKMEVYPLIGTMGQSGGADPIIGTLGPDSGASSTTPSAYSDGQNIRCNTTGAIYKIEGSNKRHYPNPAIWNSYGPPTYINVTDCTTLNAIPNVDPMPSSYSIDGQNIRCNTTGGIYRIKAGQKRPYPSIAIWNSYGPPPYINVRDCTALNALPNGTPIPSKTLPTPTPTPTPTAPTAPTIPEVIGGTNPSSPLRPTDFINASAQLVYSSDQLANNIDHTQEELRRINPKLVISI